MRRRKKAEIGTPIGPIVLIVAAILAFVSPLLCLGLYVLVPVLYVIPGPIDELVASASGE